MNRRQLMKTVPAAVAGISMKPAMGQSPKNSPKEGVLPLEQYEPKSMLHTVETHVPRSRFPLIDFHTHLTWSGELSGKDEVKLIEKPEELLPVMDRKNIHTMVDLTGGYANGLNDAIRLLQQAHPGRFIVFTEPWWSKIEDPNYPKFQADQIEAAHKAGAKGIKVLKILGLYLREHVKTGKLVAIDDRRFDPDVGSGRRDEDAGGDAYLGSGGVLPADRPIQRALGRAARASRLVLPWQRLPKQYGAPGGSPARDAEASQNTVRLPACRGFRKSRVCQ